MADAQNDLFLFLDILQIGKQICEKVKRNLFITDESTAEKLGNNCVQLIIDLALVTRRLELQNEQHQNFIQENNNLLIFEYFCV